MAAQPGKVIVVGAGPAGMALAFLLARRGISVTVLESHHDFERQFRGEGFQRSGIDAIRQMGLGEQLNRIPFVEAGVVEIFQDGKLRAKTNPAGLGRADVRLVSQPHLLQMLADESGKFPGFRLEMGVAVRDLIRNDGRVIGVRASVGSESREYRADLVIGADGCFSAVRKHSGLTETTMPQNFDMIWLKIDYPQDFPRGVALTDIGASRVAISFPAADGRLQLGFTIPKGRFAELRSQNGDAWTDMLIGNLPYHLDDYLKANRKLLSGATVLNVVCGRLAQWTVPGALLIGDAAHPMSPVGGQGVNLALRDALVAANHLCPVLTGGGDAAAIDAAAARVPQERLPEIIAAQQMQDHQGKMLAAPDGFAARCMYKLLPWLIRIGALQWLNRKEYKLMSEGVVQVKLTA